MNKNENIPYKDYSWLKDHCYRTLKKPCSPRVASEHLAILDLIKEHEERNCVLDKIRAEINSPNRGTCDYFIVDRIEEIIDKYRGE